MVLIRYGRNAYRKCKEVVRRLSSSSSKVESFANTDEYGAAEVALALKKQQNNSWMGGGNIPKAVQDPSHSTLAIEFDSVFNDLDNGKLDEDPSLFDTVLAALKRRGSKAVDLFEEAEFSDVFLPNVPEQSKVPTLEDRETKYMKLAEEQLEKYKNTKFELTVRKASLEASIILAKQAFVLGNLDAAKFIRDAYGTMEDLSEENFAELQKWTKASMLIKNINSLEESALNSLITEYGSITFDEKKAGSILHEKREEFTEKYAPKLMSVYAFCEVEDLISAFDTALLSIVSKGTQGEHNLSEWMKYLDNASIGQGLKVHIVNSYLQDNGSSIIGEVPYSSEA